MSIKVDADSPEETESTRGFPSLSQLASYVLSDFCGRKLQISLNILVIGIAALYVLVLGYFAFSAYEDSRRRMSEAGINTKIIARCWADDILDESRRFNAAKVAGLNKRPEVKVAFEQVELGVSLSLGGQNPLMTFAEGTIPADPELAESEIIWGSSITSAEAEEIVLTQPLLNTLRRNSSGDISQDDYIPDFIQLETSRTVEGNTQPFRRDYRLVGIVDSQRKKAFLPLEQIKYLDMWCNNQIDQVPGSGVEAADLELRLAAAQVFVADPVSAQKLTEMSAYFKIELTKLFSYDDLSCMETVQMRVSLPNNLPFKLSQMPALEAGQFGLPLQPAATSKMRLRAGEDGKAIVLALSPNDPRLAEIKTTSNIEVQSAIAKPGHILISARCVGLLGYSNLRAVSTIEIKGEAFPALLTVDGGVEGKLGTFEFDILCSLETLGYLHYQTETVPACLVVTSQADTAQRFKENSLKVWETKVPVPEPNSPELSGDGTDDNKSKSPQGDKEALDQKTIEDIKRKVFDIFPGLASAPPYYALTLIKGNKEVIRQELKKLADSTIDVFDVEIVPDAKVCGYPNFEVACYGDYSLTALPFNWRHRCSYYSVGIAIASDLDFFASEDIFIGGQTFRVNPVSGEPFPRGLVLVHKRALQKYNLYYGEKASNFSIVESFQSTPFNHVDVMVADLWQYDKIKTSMKSQGFIVEDLCHIERKPITCYQVKALDSPDGKIGSKLLEFLQVDRTFLDVYPLIEVQATIEGLPVDKKFSFSGSYPADRMQFRQSLKGGTWLKDDQLYRVVLPAAIFSDAGQKPEDLVDRKIQLKFIKVNTELTVDVDCLVDGVVEGEIGYLPLGLAKNVYLWQAGRIKYNQRKGFVQGEGIYTESGHASCKVFVKTMDDVKPMVDYLRARGYDTEDSLKIQANIRRLGQILTFFVVMLLVGSFLSSIANVSITTLMNTRTKMFDMAILRSCGSKKSLIIKMFIIQGVLMGVISFILALIASCFMTELVVSLLKLGFSVPIEEMISSSIFSLKYWWLHALAFVISVVFCLIGVFWSALLVSRTPITEALKARE